MGGATERDEGEYMLVSGHAKYVTYVHITSTKHNTHTRMHTYTRARTRTHIQAHALTHIHTYRHTRTHTHISPAEQLEQYHSGPRVQDLLDGGSVCFVPHPCSLRLKLLIGCNERVHILPTQAS